ncbi:MAG: hypothetical protein IT359_08355 [Gemmatimonadaceae bacterium]|nr:hypothetical protein [Gemmatimonadaceae bacterium]
MSPRVALELTPEHLRAVVASGWRDVALRTVEVAWNPAEPDGAIARLREQVGSVDAIAVAVGLGFLHVKRVELPPAPHADRERILALEGDRFFAASAPVTVALAPGGTVAFAVDADALERWTLAVERWAPVVRVDAAPVALARALAHGGATIAGDFALDAGAGEHGVVTLRGGELVSARRIPRAAGVPSGATLPPGGAVPATHLAAWGALLGEDEDERGTLAPTARRRRFAARRRRRLAVAVVAAVAGLAFALLAADRWRSRTLQALEAEVASRREAAAPGEAALAARARLDQEVAMLGRLAASRNGTLGALAAISAALPADAVIQGAHAVGRDWEIDGTASSAAALVPALDKDGRFENVRLRAASSRFRDGARTRETFSLALRVRPGA